MRLLDNDIAFKLAQYGLLDDAVSTLAGNYRAVAVLDTLAFRFRLSNDDISLKKCGDAGTRDLLRALCENAGRVPLADDSLVAELSQIPGVDVGEAQILAVASTRADDHVYTGNKRSLRALASASFGHNARQSLSGRIYCLEQVIAELINRLGFPAVANKIINRPEADVALRAIFGAGPNCREENARAGLISYYDALRNQTGNLLAPFPE